MKDLSVKWDKSIALVESQKKKFNEMFDTDDMTFVALKFTFASKKLGASVSFDFTTEGFEYKDYEQGD